MADGSSIEWTDATWQITTGCTVVSPGCTNCYAMRLAGTRLQHHPSRKGLTQDTKAGPVWNGEVRFNEQWLDQPLRWKAPRRIFVSAHSDLFHESVPDEWIDKVFAVMALAPQHTFQVLTKRSRRMREYVTGLAKSGRWLMWAHPIYGHEIFDPVAAKFDVMFRKIWLGVSVEDQARADERIPDLLATPAAVRFISAEPLLSPIDLTNLGGAGLAKSYGAHGWSAIWKNNALGRAWLDWCIVGGESGPRARPMHPDWARSLRDQCQAAGVPFFFKQHGEWLPTRDDNGEISYGQHKMHGWNIDQPGEAWAYRVGKSKAGRLLDGREWSEMPA